MHTAMTVLVIIFTGVWLCAYLSLWNAIDNIKNSLDYIKYNCNNDYEIKSAEHILRELITKSHKDLLTEIACLATKNNEDIKRLNGNYIVGDLLKFDGTRWRVFCKDILDDGRIRWKLFGKDGRDYCIYTDSIPEDLEYLGHKDLSFY